MKSTFIFLSVFLMSIPCSYAQEFFYYASNNRPCDEEEAIIKLELKDAEKDGIILNVYGKGSNKWKLQIHKEIHKKGKDQLKITVYRDREVIDKYKRIYKEAESGGYYIKEKRKGILIREGTSAKFLPLHLEGIEKRYHQNGKLKSESVYRDNQLISNKNWLFNGYKSISDVYSSVDQIPSYVEGEDRMHTYVRSSIRGSTIPVADLDGSIKVNLVIMENGTIGAIDLLQSLREDMDNVVLRAIMNLKGLWHPALLNGENVRCNLIFPVYFHLGATGPRKYKPELPGAVLFWL